MSSIKPLLLGLVFLAGLFYLIAIINAGILSVQGKESLNTLFSSAIIVIGGILSTNLGAVIGYSFTPPNNAARATLPKPFLGLRPTVHTKQPAPVPGGTSTTASNADNSPNQKAQIFACYFYVISLVIALVFYFLASSKGKPLPVLEELSKTFLGVLVGALTVSLVTRN